MFEFVEGRKWRKNIIFCIVHWSDHIKSYKWSISPYWILPWDQMRQQQLSTASFITQRRTHVRQTFDNGWSITNRMSRSPRGLAGKYQSVLFVESVWLRLFTPRRFYCPAFCLKFSIRTAGASGINSLTSDHHIRGWWGWQGEMAAPAFCSTVNVCNANLPPMMTGF